MGIKKFKIDSFVDGVARLRQSGIKSLIQRASKCSVSFYVPASLNSWYLKVPDEKAKQIAAETIPYSQSCVPSVGIPTEIKEKKFNVNICLNGSGWNSFNAPQPFNPNEDINLSFSYDSTQATNPTMQVYMNGVTISELQGVVVQSGNTFTIHTPFKAGDATYQGITGDVTIIGVGSDTCFNIANSVVNTWTNYSGSVVPSGFTGNIQLNTNDGYYFVTPLAITVMVGSTTVTPTRVNDTTLNIPLSNVQGNIVISESSPLAGTGAYVVTRMQYLPVNYNCTYSYKPDALYNKQGVAPTFDSTIESARLMRLSKITWVYSDGTGDTWSATGVETSKRLVFDTSSSVPGHYDSMPAGTVSCTITVETADNAYTITYVDMPAGTILSNEDTEITGGVDYGNIIVLPSGMSFRSGIYEGGNIELELTGVYAEYSSDQNYRKVSLTKSSVQSNIVIKFKRV